MVPVVVGVDDSEEARVALRWALDYAATAALPIVAVTAVEPVDIVGRAATLDERLWHQERLSHAEKWLRDTVRGAERESGTKVTFDEKVVDGHAVRALVDASRHADLVVVGARGAGAFRRMLLGSVSNGVVRHAHSPVVVVRAGKAPSTTAPRVVLGFDGSVPARAALQWAAGYVRAHQGTLTIVEAWEWPTFQGVPVTYGFDPRRAAKDSVERAAEESELPDGQVRTVVAKGGAAKVLLHEAAGADLLVVAPRGKGGFTGLLLGSVSNHCVHHAPCAVAVVR